MNDDPAAMTQDASHRGSRAVAAVVAPAKRGRPALRRLTLEEAAEMCAELADLAPEKLAESFRAAPRTFFPGAYQAGNLWRVPERDVWSWLGSPDELWKPSWFLRMTGLSRRKLQLMVQRKELRQVVIAGEKRIPRTEFYRLLREGEAAPRPRRSSFFIGTGS